MLNDSKLDNKRVAKNTIVLYLRTIITLCISLYTSRAILNILGVEDYGIYNVVGGFVMMFSLISSTLVSATQRYLNYELGSIKDNRSTEVFNAAFVIHAGLCVILFVLFETIGLWFLNSELNIPKERVQAANWVYQLSIITFIVGIMRAPFDASIIAHERMKTFAYANILEALLKLVIVFSLLLPFSIDGLVQYSFLMFCVSILICLIYVSYCIKEFKEIKFVGFVEHSYYKNMLSFAGYNFIGATSVVFAQQGVNMLLNIYFGVAVNAARGVTDQVQHSITKFVNDFTTAINPQITKSYAQSNIINMMNLIYKGTKISYLLFLFFAVPIIIETPLILKLWLGVVPDYAIIFVRLSLIDALLNTLAGPISTGAMATGDIKRMSIWIGIVRFSVFPFSYLLFKFGAEPFYAYIILILSDVVLFFIRLIIACGLIKVKKYPYIQNVIFKIAPVTLIVFIIAYLLNIIINVENFVSLVIYSIIICLITMTSSLILAFNSKERDTILSLLKLRKL